jgi:hypothetical protein
MKTRLLFGLLFLVALEGMGQSSKVEVLHNERIIGKNLLLPKEIKANEYIFPKRIHEFYLDTLSGYATFQLRKLSKNEKVLDITGMIVMYDLISKTVKWSKKIDYSMGNLNQYDNFLFQIKGNKTISVNIENGEEQWSVKNYFYYVNPSKKIGIGYKYKGLVGDNHTLEGIDLSNGATIWEKELNNEYGWNKKTQLNDSTLLIAAAGLHHLNIENGHGWDYHTVTGKKDYTETIAKNAAGIALGILTGTAIISTGNNLVKDVLSNELIEDNHIYFASKEKIVKLNNSNGSILWTADLPQDLTSKSSIFIKDSLLFMINKGYAYWGGKRIEFGAPFIAAYNKVNGTQQFFTLIDVKKNPILDFKLINNKVVLIHKNKISVNSLENGAELFSKLFNEDEIGELRFFLGDRLYKENNNLELSNIVSSDDDKYFVQTSKSKSIELDNEFNIINQYDFNQLYFHYLTYQNFKFLVKENQTIIIDKEGKKIAELEVSENSYIIGNKLYDVNDSRFLEVNLLEIIKN